jgi:hypothetical protein
VCEGLQWSIYIFFNIQTSRQAATITDFRPSEGYLINLVARFEMKESEIFDYCILYLSGETNKEQALSTCQK